MNSPKLDHIWKVTALLTIMSIILLIFVLAGFMSGCSYLPSQADIAIHEKIETAEAYNETDKAISS